MSEQWQRDSQWTLSITRTSEEPPCGLWNTVTLLASATVIGAAVGLLAWWIFHR